MSNPAASMDFADMEPDDAKNLIAASAIPTLDLVKLAEIVPTPKRFVIPKLAPAGEVTLFTGPGGAGKSLLAQQLATALAAGTSTLGFDIAQSTAIYITCEDDAEQLHWRQAHICKSLAVKMDSLAGSLHLASLRGGLDNALALQPSHGEFQLTPVYKGLEAQIHRTGAMFVALDNVAHLFAGNENDRGDVTRFVNALNRMAGETGAAILLLGHPNKSGDSYSGSTAWLNAVRSQITIDHNPETDVRSLSLNKANYGRKGETLRFIWHDWAFVLESDLPANNAQALRETVQASADNALFLACLRERVRQKRAVSEKQSSSYAPKVFASMAESKRIGTKRLEAAMERLFRINAIERGEMGWDDGHRHPVIGLRETAGVCAGNTSAANAGDYP